MFRKASSAQFKAEQLQPASGLHSEVVKHRLNQIDQIRAEGVGNCISLPQLVVSGDQSSGKSSVLTAVTGFSFPRREGTCTRFATEIILRHSKQTETIITASIIPSLSRHDGSEEALKRFKKVLKSTEELPSVIHEASVAMGIRGYSDSDDSPAFTADVLRIEVVGDTGLCLTIVDLPGLISVSDYDEGEADVQLVNTLIDSYLANTRSIILAVVQASNDIQNQNIIQRARRFDKLGERTVGIITKPDLVNKGTESHIVRLANNLDIVRLKLGFFLMKNPSPEQLKNNISMFEWKQKELEFFNSPPWKDLMLDHNRVGAECLRSFLEKILEEHIERELPKVCDEIQTLLQQTRDSLSDLGDERSSVSEQRKYLLKISMDYLNLIQAALNGRYQEVEPTFFGNASSKPSFNRLRARIHELNTNFATYIRDKGQKRKVAGDREPGMEDFSADQTSISCRDAFPEPLRISEQKFKIWIHKNTRGLELPGNHNHVFLSELFHEQSSRWPAIASQHVRRVNQETADFAHRALDFIVKDRQVAKEILNIINPILDINFRAAQEELQKICDDEKLQPITYNHYYTDTIQKARYAKLRDFLRQVLGRMRSSEDKHHKGESYADYAKLLASIDNQPIPDMDQVSCEKAMEELDAYYKVSMKTFVDNICRQVLERHILRPLQSTFYPTEVGAFSDRDIRRIASESSKIAQKRQELKNRAEALERSLVLLSESTDALFDTE
ncbi:hypothetical protein KXV31_002325 [Aspergillus fumigatus]|nr:hypothetical protein KXX63_002066 [Aspergillus fumigatus]KAH1806653.1 hypothetical protein KXX19_002330 [Aspergillus fumigatus]KAH2021957.1 hypothetical protein KXV65_002220 [Aspergillus fumigatus]KAH2062180.1 hypothetical protein KXX03_003447 [Aspergillus fumigatus]KAH2253934.1 hypothetical protein KXW26_001825 [Aspergillus fumigatus]